MVIEMGLRSLEQERARFAWDAVGKVDEKFEKEYKSLVKKAPTLIMTNGLGNTLGYLKAKGRGHHNKLVTDIDGWGAKRGIGNGDVLQWIMAESTTSFDVMQASKEILNMLNWLKRFATAELKGEEE